MDTLESLCSLLMNELSTRSYHFLHRSSMHLWSTTTTAKELVNFNLDSSFSILRWWTQILTGPNFVSASSNVKVAGGTCPACADVGCDRWARGWREFHLQLDGRISFQPRSKLLSFRERRTSVSDVTAHELIVVQFLESLKFHFIRYFTWFPAIRSCLRTKMYYSSRILAHNSKVGLISLLTWRSVSL